MKNLLFLFTLAVGLLFSNAINAQNTIIVCGSVVGTNGVPVTVYLADSASGINSTVLTDLNGNFCDTLSVASTQGYISVNIIDCNGNYVGQYVPYSPANNQFTFTFNYCNSVPSTNVVVCVTVDNLPGGLSVPVIVYAAPGTVGDTLIFTGTGTQTICDTFAVATGTGSVLLSMIDCNGNSISTTATYNPFFPTANVTMNYCQVLTPVTVCGIVAGTNGMAVNVMVTDSLTGQVFTFVTDTSGNFCDSLMLPSASGILLAYIVDCNGNTIYQTATYSPTGPNYLFNFNYCNSIPSYVVVCVTVDNLPGVNTIVPVIINSNPGGTGGDTLFFSGTGTLTICDTVQTTGSGLVLINMLDCNGIPVVVTAQYNPAQPFVNITLDYCNTTPPCYAFWTSTYDSTNNTFYITVDSLTMAQAQTYFWDFGDSTFSTIGNPIHQYAANGLYNVCLTINATVFNPGCTYCHTIGINPNGGIVTRTAGFNVVVLPQFIGIPEIESSNFAIYPNPVTDVLTINALNSYESIDISIYSITGEKVVAQHFDSPSTMKLDVNNYKAGLYFVKIQSKSSLETIKFIKE